LEVTVSTHLVKDLLQQKDAGLFTTTPETTVQDALEIMVSKGISSLAVLSGQELVGIISERDYIRKAVPKRIVPWEIKVRDIMTANVISVTSENTVRECMELMSSKRIRHLPVVDGKALIGMLSITDIIRALKPARIDFPG
jgi:CBS domain-containing protein